jgi:hypothetical protein
MTNRMTVAALVATLTLAQTILPATAQSTNRVAAAEQWAVFVEDDPRECWGVSKPRDMVNTRDGREVQVRRGDTLLFVAFRPDSETEGEVSFTGGYPFREGSTVTLRIGDDSYELFTEGEWAWPAGTEEDAAIVESMKRGIDAVVVGTSSRGTRTEDTFSLMGFTEAMEEAAARCPS